jgi:hypothetical protein
MNPGGLVLNVTRCNLMEYKSKLVVSPAIPRCGIPGPAFLHAPVEDQIMDFLDGRTHGEGVLHVLYDYILDEPVPERMRSLLSEPGRRSTDA